MSRPSYIASARVCNVGTGARGRTAWDLNEWFDSFPDLDATHSLLLRPTPIAGLVDTGGKSVCPIHCFGRAVASRSVWQLPRKRSGGGVVQLHPRRTIITLATSARLYSARSCLIPIDLRGGRAMRWSIESTDREISVPNPKLRGRRERARRGSQAGNSGLPFLRYRNGSCPAPAAAHSASLDREASRRQADYNQKERVNR